MSQPETTSTYPAHRDGLAVPATPGVGDYFALLKPRVMSLVVFTAIVGMVAAPGEIHPVIGFVALISIAVAAGASGAINMWYDADIDAVMTRTKNRPVPSGRVAPGEALVIGLWLSVASVAMMGLFVNLVAAFLLAFTIAFYIFVYTMWLKRRTPQNIVIGGAAGAFPPMVAWAAVTGDIGIGAMILFALIFIWTPPHFWALSLYRDGDYAKAGVPMLPVVHGHDETKRQMLIYTLVLAPLSIAPAVIGMAGPLYLAGAIILSALFIRHAVRVLRSDSSVEERRAKAMFGFSLIYLSAIFALLLIERLLQLPVLKLSAFVGWA